MEILNNPSRDTWDALTERNIPNDAAIEESVREIVATVKAQGDEALRTYARKFDGAEITEIEISEAERQAATAKVAENVKRAIATAAKISRLSTPRNVQFPLRWRQQKASAVTNGPCQSNALAFTFQADRHRFSPRS